MDLLSLVQKAIDSGLLAKALVFLPASGAPTGAVANLERSLDRRLSPGYVEFLARWNGADLDVIRVHGVGADGSGIPNARPLSAKDSASLVVASDPSGFIYVEAADHSIHSVDHDGGATKVLAPDFVTFMTEFVFGSRAAQFLGEDWLRELKAKGFV